MNTPSGAVQAFRDIRRELTEADLATPGVQKLVLNQLDAALARCDVLSSFETRFHERDKRVEVLEERLRKRLGIDIAWGAGVSIGLVLVTLAQGAWDTKPPWLHVLLLAFGAALVLGGIVIRAVLQ